MYSGILHTSDEGDFKISSSYFSEAFNNYDKIGDKEMAIRALKYVLLCKVCPLCCCWRRVSSNFR